MNDYEYWTELAKRASEVNVKPLTVVVDDEDFQIDIQKALNRHDTRYKNLQDAKNTFDTWYFGRPVIGKILILPRSAAKNFTYDKPWACISIADDESELPKINAVQRRGLLQLTFLDRDIVRNDGLNYFQKNHAQQIIDFVGNAWNDIDLMMIHCYAGLSRSPAVGKALSDEYQQNHSKWFDQLYQPNQLVYQTLKKMDWPS